MSLVINPQLINEIWSDYKYPRNEGQELSKTGYDVFNDYDFNEQSYDHNTNIQGQASLGNNKPKIFEANKNDYNMNNYSGNPPNGNVFEGFQPNPMDHPSITNPNVDTYNNKPYNYRNGPPRNYFRDYKERDEECIEHIEHILRCRHCYEHLREKLGLDNNNKQQSNIFSSLRTGNVNNLLDIALLVMGGAFLLFVLDTLVTIRRK